MISDAKTYESRYGTVDDDSVHLLDDTTGFERELCSHNVGESSR
jgi:hypothetical protein